MSNDDEPTYDEIIEMLTDLPQTWLPALFFHIADECKRRGVWAEGREARVVGQGLNSSIDRAAELLLKTTESIPETFAGPYRESAEKLRSDAPETFPGVTP